MNKCVQCGIEIEQTGNRTKQYCSDACRKAYTRSIRTETDNPIRTKSNPDTSIRTEDKPTDPLAILDPATNPNTTEFITLSDGQQFYPDPRPKQVLDQWQQSGTPIQRQYASLSDNYDQIRSGPMARGQEGTINV